LTVAGDSSVPGADAPSYDGQAKTLGRSLAGEFPQIAEKGQRIGGPEVARVELLTSQE
jgi:hypothetical protein